MAIELLDAVRLARTASGLLIEHATSIAEAARLDWAEESARLKKFMLGMQLLAVLVGLTLLYAGVLIVALTWNTPYRMYAIAVLPLLFAMASYLAWRYLGQLSQKREERFAIVRTELSKTLYLLRSYL
ncbi:hypothetical protein CJD38_13705 [Stenotrophobium rhamnosiphilum]|uniref:Phage holin family protein n=1 Tax=Stenotrophobium rhamnosiphilum TaxID=2029166 RepID=A0A2T5MDB1_9GAMM|nr:hypothetical protein CJD38_13705 [Stenotrophobium rhamnosiphilum]